MRYIKKILDSDSEYKYRLVGVKFIGSYEISIILGDTDDDDYEEVISVDRRSILCDIKGVYTDLYSSDYVFVAYTKLSALLEDCINPVKRVHRNNIPIYRTVTAYPVSPYRENPLILDVFTPYIYYKDNDYCASVAEWLIYHADNSVFDHDMHTIIFKYKFDTAYKYSINDEGLSYLSRARLLA